MIAAAANAAQRTGNVVHNTSDFAYERLEVEFPSCGHALSGLLLRPKPAGERLPAIVMAPGMSGVKEGSIYKYADFFARGGFAVLAYDNINFGASGGDIRQEADAMLQRRGYRDAITFMGLRADVDKERIGIWGTSMSGGHVLEVAAHDRRVKCVVSQIAGVSGYQSYMRRIRPDQRKAYFERLDADREARFLGKPPTMVRAVSDDPSEFCAMPGRSAFDYFMEQARQAPNWKNEVTLRSIDIARGLENGAFMPYIFPTPLMMIVALQDELAPADLTIAAFRKLNEPKKLVLVPGHHFSPYVEQFALTSNEARDWFTRHLMIGGSIALN